MMPRTHAASGRLATRRVAAAVVLVCLLAVATSCHDPQAPAPTPPVGDSDWSGAFVPGSQTLEFKLESAGGQATPLLLVASALSFDTSTHQLHAQVAIRNTGSVAVAGPEGVLVGGFDPSTVQPVNAAGMPCPACVPCPCPYPWRFEYAGKYGEDGLLSPDETSSPVEWILSDPTDESFAFHASAQRGTSVDPGTIAGVVFVDENANGTRDLAEPGIPNAVVHLGFGATNQVTQTDARGHYAFVVEQEGLYEVRRAPASDCTPTSPSMRQVFIVRRADGTLSAYDRADFGCGGGVRPDSSLYFVGVLFNDLNRNGVHEAGEPGVAGVGVNGFSGCPTFAPIRTFTDGEGNYRLELPRCAPPYVVGHDAVAGFVDTSPNPLTFGDDGVVPGDSLGTPLIPPVRLLRADFGIALADSANNVSVEGFVYRDANRNGQHDDDEPGAPGVRVTASSLLCMAPVIGSAITDALGHYVLTQVDVHCGLPWSVQHETVPGACDTSPNPVIIGIDQPVYPPLPSAGRYHVDFGVAACDTVPPPGGVGIAGIVYLDLDSDGQHDDGEPGMPGVGLSLDSMCDVWRATQTDASGRYRFTPEVVGGCPVSGVRQYAPVFPAYTTPNPFPVDLSTVPPGTVLQADFGIQLIAVPR